jgi:hypothetical protein
MKRIGERIPEHRLIRSAGGGECRPDTSRQQYPREAEVDHDPAHRRVASTEKRRDHVA